MRLVDTHTGLPGELPEFGCRAFSHELVKSCHDPNVRINLFLRQRLSVLPKTPIKRIPIMLSTYL